MSRKHKDNKILIFIRVFIPFKDKGTFALVITNVLTNTLRLFSNLILSRFLSPEAFAITGLASTIIFAFNMLSDGGFRAFILRHNQGDQNHFLNTLWTIKLIRDLILAILMFSFSGIIASYLEVSDLSFVLKILSLVFVFNALSPISSISIERQYKISIVMYTQFASLILSMTFSIVGVFFYKSYWPIIYSLILNNLFQTLLGYLFMGSKGSRLSIDRAVSIEFLSWSKYIIPSSILTLLLMHFDKVILAKMLSVDELGLYFVAFNFSSAAGVFCIQYARGVLFPYMSLIYRENPQDYLPIYYSKKMKLSIFSAFFFGVLSGGSFIFFDIFYSDQYLPAAYYLSILLITPVMTLITYTSEISLIIHGQVRITLIANIIRFAWILLAVWFGFLWFEVRGILCAITLIEVFPAVYMIYKLQRINFIRIGMEILILCSAIFGFILTRLIILLTNE